MSSSTLHCPHPCWTLQVEHCQHSCGCKEDRGTGKNLGHPLGHQDAAVGMTVMTGKSQPYGVFPMLPGGAGRHGIPMHYSAVLHHKSQLACTKRCWDPLSTEKNKRNNSNLPLREGRLPVLLKGEAPCLLELSHSPAPRPALHSFSNLLKSRSWYVLAIKKNHVYLERK